MGKVTICSPTEADWLTGETARVADMRDLPDHQEVQGMKRVHHPGSDASPELFEVQVAPGQHIRSHAHAEDEIIYVVDGEMRIGARVLRSGSSVFIEGMTPYSFRSGPQGLRFLNFRPRADQSYIAMERFREASAGDPRDPGPAVR